MLRESREHGEACADAEFCKSGGNEVESGEYLDRADRCWEERGRSQAGKGCAEGHRGGGLQESSIFSYVYSIMLGNK